MRRIREPLGGEGLCRLGEMRSALVSSVYAKRMSYANEVEDKS